MNYRTSLSRMSGLVVIVLLLAACGTLQPTPTPTSIPATDTPVPPTATPTPEIIPASQASITIGEFECRVVQVVFDDTVFGTVPNSMGATDRILYVEFELTAGENEAFANLMPDLVLSTGPRRTPVAWFGNNTIHTLVNATMTGEGSQFSPGEDTVALAYVVPQTTESPLMAFPSGDLIDLTPLMPE